MANSARRKSQGQNRVVEDDQAAIAAGDKFYSESWFWRWLADQPAFVEVGIGMLFVLVLAPATLVSVAIVITRLEALAATIAVWLLSPDRKAVAIPSGASKLDLLK